MHEQNTSLNEDNKHHGLWLETILSVLDGHEGTLRNDIPRPYQDRRLRVRQTWEYNIMIRLGRFSIYVQVILGPWRVQLLEVEGQQKSLRQIA